jgi:hypothetical protein
MNRFLQPVAFEIFNYHQSAARSWKSLGPIPAQPLPMLVTLTKVSFFSRLSRLPLDDLKPS